MSVLAAAGRFCAGMLLLSAAPLVVCLVLLGLAFLMAAPP